MLKKVSTTTLWLMIFMAIIAVQAYSAFGQANELMGSWKNGSVGTISYQNRVTGSTKPGRGSIFTYKFKPNGTYEFVGYMEVTMYNCTTTLFNNITGRYSVDGSTVNLSPSRDYWKNTNSCAASGNKETTKTPTRKTLQFERRQDEYGNQLLCMAEAGAAETCYRREQ
jgi:hypothetical protein